MLGLSGAALVFRAEIETMESATRVVADARPPAPSLDGIVAVARTRHPTAEPRALRMPTRPGRPYRVELLADRQRVEVAVDPSSLQIIGGRAPERSLMVAVHSLHARLHTGRAGSVVVGLLGLWLVVESVTGLWLCWPAVRRRARGVAPTEGAPSRGLHRLVGGLSLGLGVVIALTGAVLAVASALTSIEARAPRADGSGLSRLDMIAARFETARPGARIAALVADGDTIRVETTAGAVIVDRETGRIADAPTDRGQLGAGAWIRRLHAGDFAGWASRIVYALVGLALPLLSVTGYLITARRAAPS